MADPHLVLAPLIEPPLPPVPEAAVASVAQPVLLAVTGLALFVLLLVWWWRRAPLRALRRIAHLNDAVQAADRLAQWQRRYKVQGRADWLLALDRLRFGPRDEEGLDTLQRLCAEAAAFAGRR